MFNIKTKIKYKFSKIDNKKMYFIQIKVLFLFWKDMKYLFIEDTVLGKIYFITHKYSTYFEAENSLKKMYKKLGLK